MNGVPLCPLAGPLSSCWYPPGELIYIKRDPAVEAYWHVEQCAWALNDIRCYTDSYDAHAVMPPARTSVLVSGSGDNALSNASPPLGRTHSRGLMSSVY